MPATDEPSSVVGSPLASWSLEMLTTSSSTTPSTTQSGLFSPLIDVTPRTRTLGAAPNVPETFWICTPAALPSSMRLMSVSPLICKSSVFNLTDEPVKVDFLSVWKPVTTTSSMPRLSLARAISRSVRAPSSTVCAV